MPILFVGKEDPINKYIRINGIKFQVVGVFDLPNKNDNSYEEDSKAVYLPLSTFQQTFNWGATYALFPNLDVKQPVYVYINYDTSRSILVPYMWA